MKPDKNETVVRFVLSLICFAAYISCFFAVIGSAVNTSSHYSL